jgi:hypothetical protein
VDHAPFASDPVCAEVLQQAPAAVTGLIRRTTTSQGSRAWGENGEVVLRCGVEPPAPSTQRCVRVTGADGGSVDWIAVESAHGWVFVTYGRRPAVEVSVRREPGDGRTEAGSDVVPAQPTAALVDLAPALAATAVERSCL